MAAPEGSAPSLAMVAAGGFGVLVVVAFVAVLALGSRARSAEPGDRVAVGRGGPRDEVLVVVPRCRDERVTGVEVREAEGDVRWRITSRKGSIDERYVVGATPVPLGFDVAAALRRPLPEETPLVARALIDGGEVADEVAFVAGELPADGVWTADGERSLASFHTSALAAARCPESRPELGAATLVFGIAALGVVATYGLMVSRWWTGRRPR